MTKVVVLIPVLARPQRTRAVVASLARSARAVELEPFFLCSPGDDAEIAEVEAVYLENVRAELPIGYTIVDWEAGAGDYARKINWGVEHAFAPRPFLPGELEAEYVFLGADDLIFHPGWAECAITVQRETDACVIGTNDLGNARVVAGRHATHSLVHRDYVACGTIDEPGTLLHEGYDHQFVDTEFCETAMARGTFVSASDSIVEHLHPFWGKGDDDATYQKGQRAAREDQMLYESRRRLWER